MKRGVIKMTDKQKLNLLRAGIQTAKELQDKASAALDLVYKALDDLGIDPADVKTDAENADNLSEAISCYISYGEYSIDGLMKEIRAAYIEGVM